MPKGMSGPGKVSTSPDVPMSGLTNDAGSPTKAGAADADTAPSAWSGRTAMASTDTAARRLRMRLRNLGGRGDLGFAITCLHGGGCDLTDDVQVRFRTTWLTSLSDPV